MRVESRKGREIKNSGRGGEAPVAPLQLSGLGLRLSGEASKGYHQTQRLCRGLHESLGIRFGFQATDCGVESGRDSFSWLSPRAVTHGRWAAPGAQRPTSLQRASQSSAAAELGRELLRHTAPCAKQAGEGAGASICPQHKIKFISPYVDVNAKYLATSQTPITLEAGCITHYLSAKGQPSGDSRNICGRF